MSEDRPPTDESAPDGWLGEIHARALGYPEVTEAFPWGERAYKVRGKTFLFMHQGQESTSLTVKLPHSAVEAMHEDFAEPSGYNLGKSGWITSRFPHDQTPPLELLLDWLDESYRAIAPKRLVSRLET